MNFLSNYCYSIYHNILNVINCFVFLFIFRHGPLTRQRNSRDTRDCFEVLSESSCEGRYSEMSSEARHFCVAARVIRRNDFCSGAATDACPSKSMHPWSRHNPRAYNLPMGCINKECPRSIRCSENSGHIWSPCKNYIRNKGAF